MSYTHLTVEKKDGFAILTISRPDALNALNTPLLGELGRAVGELSADAGARAVILTGAGEKAFVAGADIRELEAFATPEEARQYLRRGQVLFDCIENMGKPVIAAVNGYALGGGCELAMACSIRIASEKAIFGQPEINLGTIPGYGGTQRLPRLIGKGPALEYLLSGKNMSAAEAHRLGLVNAIFPPEKLLPAAEEMAKLLASKSATAQKIILDCVNRGLGMTLDDGLLFEATAGGIAMLTHDAKKGFQAFLQKKK